MEIFIKMLVSKIMSFINYLIYEFKKNQINTNVETSNKEQKDASEKADNDYDDFKSAYDKYKSSRRTNDL
jgi:hypothetical protein